MRPGHYPYEVFENTCEKCGSPFLTRRGRYCKPCIASATKERNAARKDHNRKGPIKWTRHFDYARAVKKDLKGIDPEFIKSEAGQQYLELLNRGYKLPCRRSHAQI